MAHTASPSKDFELNRRSLDAWLGPALGVGLVGLLGSDGGTVLCPFRRITDGYCPLCGGTRAAANLVTGDISASWANHPMVLLLAVQVPLLVLLALRTEQHSRQALVQRWLGANLAVAIGVWLWRLGIDAIPRPTTIQNPL